MKKLLIVLMCVTLATPVFAEAKKPAKKPVAKKVVKHHKKVDGTTFPAK